jgi:hypothetical protein
VSWLGWPKKCIHGYHVATTSKKIRGKRRNGYFKKKAGEAEEEEELVVSLDSRSLAKQTNIGVVDIFTVKTITVLH